MASAEPPPPGPRLISLRYKGTCEACGAALEARTKAWYDPARRKVRCSVCGPAAGGPAPIATSKDQQQALSTALPPPADAGHAGASALRKYERLSERHHERAAAEVARDAAWRDQVKQDHPLLGRLASALAPKPTIGPEPQSVTAWQTGSHGEARVGGVLDAWAATVGAVVLHDRKIPGSRANIDHLVIARSGVWSIDAKEYKGAVAKVDVGGWSRADFRLEGRRPGPHQATGRPPMADGPGPRSARAPRPRPRRTGLGRPLLRWLGLARFPPETPGVRGHGSRLAIWAAGGPQHPEAADGYPRGRDRNVVGPGLPACLTPKPRRPGGLATAAPTPPPVGALSPPAPRPWHQWPRCPQPASRELWAATPADRPDAAAAVVAPRPLSPAVSAREPLRRPA
jgi:hypothetical protein